jgi:hypothetical protein
MGQPLIADNKSRKQKKQSRKSTVGLTCSETVPAAYASISSGVTAMALKQFSM